MSLQSAVSGRSVASSSLSRWEVNTSASAEKSDDLDHDWPDVHAKWQIIIIIILIQSQKKTRKNFSNARTTSLFFLNQVYLIISWEFKEKKNIQK